MVRELLGAIETGALAQVGLLAFVVAFVAIVIYAFSLSGADRERAKNQPLSDPEPHIQTPTPTHG
ncbi:MAG: cbb3-type cytochrome c oxidase subunit 3 [Rhodothermales bacterium]|nr:cbb3-type cytochrome c oxidase subunit 3 [Rhodothermales bacterium]MBO6781329.1 cbb3-type cytochrome c oxidase subunit 3 [Rhodothermales bacterium]